MFEIELFWHLNCVLMLYWIVWNRTVCMYKTGFDINNLQWLMCHKTKPNQTKQFICLNLWDEAWCALCWLWFFGLLFSSLLLLVEAQRFSCCILQPSSGVPCLSGYGNDSTRRIIFNVWQLIKQVLQEIVKL